MKGHRNFTIGTKTYKSKKEALEFYKSILNKYDFGQSLNDEDYNLIIDLLEYGSFFDFSDSEPPEEENNAVDEMEAEDESEIVDVRIGKAQFSTKCFELVYSDMDSQFISYILLINQPNITPLSGFVKACRNSVCNDLHAVKQKFFDLYSVKGSVKCQETGLDSKWEELVVDHRQPNTFSVIVDRFLELNQINLEQIEYKVNEDNLLVFEDDLLNEKFRAYHKEKANLRIVRKERNVSRSYLARNQKQSKDLKIF